MAPRHRSRSASPVGTAVPGDMPFQASSFADDRGVPMISASLGEEEELAEEDAVEDEGQDGCGEDENPGFVPWNVFLLSSFVLALLWWASAVHEITQVYHKVSNTHVQARYGPIKDGEVAPLPLLLGVRANTSWYSLLQRPRGLTCAAEGSQLSFMTVGRALDGGHGLLHGRLDFHSFADNPPTLLFEPLEAPVCDRMMAANRSLHDFTLQACSYGGACAALILPHQGEDLVSCALRHRPEATVAPAPASLPLGRAWLEDYGSASLEAAEGSHSRGGHLHAEEISSVEAISCNASLGRPERDCVVVGTTAGRVVQMSVVEARDGTRLWAPRRTLLENPCGEVLGPGAFAVLEGGRFLAVLQRGESVLLVLDLERGGAHVTKWRLPPLVAGSGWASVCATGDDIFALEDGEEPALWRLPIPTELLLEAQARRVVDGETLPPRSLHANDPQELPCQWPAL